MVLDRWLTLGPHLARGLGVSRNEFLVEAVRLGYGPAVESLRQSGAMPIDSEIETVMQQWRVWQEHVEDIGFK